MDGALMAHDADTAKKAARLDATPRRTSTRRNDAGVKTINLALQGGGAHGAFSWGALDRLLEDERVAFDGISATSAGAMNAAVLASGLTNGGRSGAKAALEQFWRRVSRMGTFSPMRPTIFDRLIQDHAMRYSPAAMAFDLMTRLMSPYQFNPLNVNPLRAVLAETIDFEQLRHSCAVKLFLCATNVRSGKVKIFDNEQLSVDAVLASSCLPFLFHAVEIDGEAYWDGGYMGNPAIYPLIYHTTCTDVLIVHINPMCRDEVPRTAADILNRINEVSFNSSLMREMRAIAFVTKLIETGQVKEGSMQHMLIHEIEAEEFMRTLGAASKMNPDWEFLTWLRDVGREAADAWLKEHFDDIGRRSTIDIRDRYL
jgi:NTE family protein